MTGSLANTQLHFAAVLVPLTQLPLLPQAYVSGQQCPVI